MSRGVTIVLQIALVAVVLAVVPFKLFELDRYFVPKELVLHVAALGAAVLLLARGRSLRLDAADTLLAFFLIWSIASALFATNYWLAQRALGVSVSGALVFWATRQLGAEGAYRPIVVAAAVLNYRLSVLHAFAAATVMVDRGRKVRSRAPVWASLGDPPSAATTRRRIGSHTRNYGGPLG